MIARRRLAIKAAAAAAGAAGLASVAPVLADVEIGKVAPALDLKLLNGKVLKGRQLQGKVVVQMYWATWCPYCRADLPEMQRVYQLHNARGLEIVALSIDESEKTARDFWKGKNYTFPSGMRSNEYFQHYGRIGTTPTYVIIDRSGIVRQRINGAPEPGVIEQLVVKLL
jgi:thiol-disulfide isomerase/thioredoxin